MTCKFFAVLITLSLVLPVNAMTITASNHWLMVQEVSALNNQEDFRLNKMYYAFDFNLKTKISDMRQRYNLLYAGILTKHVFSVNDINTDLDIIWQKAQYKVAESTMHLLMLSPFIMDIMVWETYKKDVLDFTNSLNNKNASRKIKGRNIKDCLASEQLD